ncbi:cholinesterase 2-like [Schistocerca nitens]|uniref:cholinesterase 2-like n=1 Tax=Schistocerca nitens TaxID=7011 RepID=UPI002117E614|nr:cholinesterase 2-like [Schistocerca nitens]
MRAMTGLGSLLLAAVLGTACAQDFAVKVNVAGVGMLGGSLAWTKRQNRTIYQFLGVPYANVTTRFQEPSQPVNWTGTRNATAYGPACVQFFSSGSSSLRHPAADVDPVLVAAAAMATPLSQSEYCLTMDIYSPNMTAKLPVLVYVHGGAFVGGSSQQVQPHFLLDHDIVLVAPQYRLGPLGFLSLQTDDVPGNAGLMDQLAALQWVHDHISQFGGDPAKVTLAGGSAGAASVALLQLSPLSKPTTGALFQQVFLESGSALAPWSVEDDPLSRAAVIANSVKCTDETLLAECLRNATIPALMIGFVQSAIDDMLSGGTGLGGALPVVQTNITEKAVLTKKPLDAIRDADFRAVPMLVGVAKHEGIMPLALLGIYNRIINSTYGEDFYQTKTVNDLVRRVMMIEENRVATDAVADKYFKPGTLDSLDAMRPSLIDLAGAVHFKGPALTTVEFNSKTGNTTYLYSFNHQDKYNYEAVGHGGDFPYLFPQPNVNLTAEEDSVSQKMVQLLANFVIYGKTTASPVAGVPEWRPYTLQDPSFLLVDKAPQLRQDFERQLTVAASEGLRKQASAATACCVASVATLVAVVAASLAFH